MGCLCSCFHVTDEQDSASLASCRCPKCWFKKFINKAKYENIPHQSGTRNTSNRRDNDSVIPQAVSNASVDSSGPSNHRVPKNPNGSRVQPESNGQTDNIRLGEISEEKSKSVASGSKIGSQEQNVESSNESDYVEDVCPTCFEEYTEENPKITAKCSHHYHLACIFEWLERSELCPACSRLMEY